MYVRRIRLDEKDLWDLKRRPNMVCVVALGRFLHSVLRPAESKIKWWVSSENIPMSAVAVQVQVF